MHSSYPDVKLLNEDFVQISSKFDENRVFRDQSLN